MTDAFPKTSRMPALFVGHGSPMNAIEDNEFSRSWAELGRSMPRPAAILMVSGHWVTRGARATAAANPRTIYDFGGFPRELSETVYAAPGSPALVKLLQDTVRLAPIEPDEARGFDHGAWSVLCRMFPKADVPVVQLSLDGTKGARVHYELGRELRPLRHRGVLVMGSGNIVHNLGRMAWSDTSFDWAKDFDGKMKRFIEAGDHEAVIDYKNLGEAAAASVPTEDHFLPLLYVLGLQEPGEPVGFFNEKVTLGSMSMRSVRIG